MNQRPQVLYDPLSCVVIKEVRCLSVVVDLLYPVLFVPEDGALLAGGLAGPAGHVAVVVVGVELGAVVGNGMGLAAAVGVIEHVVGGLGKGRGRGRLDDLVHLDLLGHVADGVVGEGVGVVVLFARAETVLALGARYLVQVVIAEGLGYRACWERGVRGHIDAVREAQDVAHEVVLVAEVLDLPVPLAGIERGDEGGEPAGQGVVGVVRGCIVPVFDMGPLAVFVVEEAVDVVVPVAALFAPGCFEQSAVVVAVVQGLPVGVGHIDHPAEGVEDVLVYSAFKEQKKLDRMQF